MVRYKAGRCAQRGRSSNLETRGNRISQGTKGATSDFEFAYDEVLIVIRGRCTVASRDEWQTAGPGEVLYLPAGTPGTINALEDLELVYVASSPYGEVNRVTEASLLATTPAEAVQ